MPWSKSLGSAEIAPNKQQMKEYLTQILFIFI